MKQYIRFLCIALLGITLSVRAQSAEPRVTTGDPPGQGLSQPVNLIDIYPNPVTDKAYIGYQLSSDVRAARLMIYNILGNRVKEIELPRHGHKVELPANELRSGVYFYSLYADGVRQETKRLVVK